MGDSMTACSESYAAFEPSVRRFRSPWPSEWSLISGVASICLSFEITLLESFCRVLLHSCPGLGDEGALLSVAGQGRPTCFSACQYCNQSLDLVAVAYARRSLQ